MIGGIASFLFGLVPLLIVVGLVVAVVTARQPEGTPEDPGIGTLRRVFFYLLSLAGLTTAGIGMVLLVRAVLDTTFHRTILAIGETTLALGLALTIVGAPVWLVFWWLIHRAVRGHPIEVRALSRKVYLYAVLTGSLLTAAAGALSFLQWALGSGSFSGTPPALLLVWGGLWAYHWWVEQHDDQLTEATATIRRLYVYALAIFGLIWLAVGTGSALHLTLLAAYRAIFGAPALVTGRFELWNDAMRAALAMAVIGGAIWWWHWHRAARGDVESRLRSVVLYLLAILGGAATVVTSGTVALYHVLQWFVGKPATASARDHFDVFPGLIAAAVVGAGVWGYHWSVTQREAGVAARGLRAARRVYLYLVSAVGLVTLGVGLVILFAVFFGLIAPSGGPSLRGDLWRNPLVLSVTLLAIGAPVWWIFWRDVQHMVATDERAERAALSRRVFIYATFGASVILTLVNLSTVLYNLFNTVLGGRTASALLWDIRWSLAILLTAGSVSGYYWLVLREDRQAAPEAEEAEVPHPNITVLAGAGQEPVVQRLAARLGYPVAVWQRTDAAQPLTALSDEDLAHAAQAIAEARSSDVLLLFDADGIRVIPYAR